MGRDFGSGRLGSAYNVTYYSPLDTRQLVPTQADLTNSANWLVDGTDYTYNGMFVGVGCDSDLTKNSIYILFDPQNPGVNDAPDYTNLDNWHKLATFAELKAAEDALRLITERVAALEANGGSSIGVDSFDTTYFKLNDQQKITLNNILSQYSAVTDYTNNEAIPTVGFVTAMVEGKIDAAHKVISTQRRYKVITTGTPDFANPPSFDSMDDFGTATPDIVQGNWMWSATRLIYENEGTITSYALSYVGKDGTPGENGLDGVDGIDGLNGETPHIGDNGNWFVGDTDTSVKAQGPAGPNFIDQVGNQKIDNEFLADGNTLNIFAPQSQTAFTGDGDVKSTAYDPSARLNSTMFVSIYDETNGNKFVYAPLVIDDGILE